MADITANRYWILGTAAQRAAFTPVPIDISSIGPGEYLLPVWAESDTGDVYYWDEVNGPAWVLFAGGGGSGITALTGDVTATGPGSVAATLDVAYKTQTIGITVDGGGSVLTTGIKGYRSLLVDGEIVRWRLLADAAGDIEFDIFLDPFASYPPTTSIVAAAPPVLSAADSDEDTTLTGWTTAVTAGDVFGFEITGVPDTITRVTLELTIEVAA